MTLEDITPYHQGFELLVNAGTSWGLAPRGAVTLLARELAVPGQNSLRFGDRGDLAQGLLPQLLAQLSKGGALCVGEWHSSWDLVA
jgi:hypothetical protein